MSEFDIKFKRAEMKDKESSNLFKMLIIIIVSVIIIMSAIQEYFWVKQDFTTWYIFGFVLISMSLLLYLFSKKEN